MTAKSKTDNPENELNRIAKLAGCKPEQITNYRATSEGWVVVIQHAKSVEKKTVSKPEQKDADNATQ